MAERFSTRLLTVSLIAMLAVAGCAPTSGGSGQAPTASSSPSSPSVQSWSDQKRDATPAEAELERRSAAMQRTLFEAAGVGAVIGGGIGGSFGIRGLISAAMIGAAAAMPAATYVSTVQEEYATEEKRLERVEADLDLSNQEAEAALVAMRDVLAEQRATLDSIRARIASDTAAKRALDRELGSLRRNVATMEKAIQGASERRAQLGEARSIALNSANSVATLDPKLQALSRRIAAMREIADALSERI